MQRRYDLFDALEAYQKQALTNIQAPDSFVKARLMTLFLELQGMLKRRWYDSKKDELKKFYDTLKSICMGEKKDAKMEDVYSAIYVINEFLDNIRLTRVDTQQQYNPQSMETENEVKGF